MAHSKRASQGLTTCHFDDQTGPTNPMGTLYNQYFTLKKLKNGFTEELTTCDSDDETRPTAPTALWSQWPRQGAIVHCNHHHHHHHICITFKNLGK